MFRALFGTKSDRPTPPKNQIEVVCPACGAAQYEPRLVVSTFCKKCGVHLTIHRKRVTASNVTRSGAGARTFESTSATRPECAPESRQPAPAQPASPSAPAQVETPGTSVPTSGESPLSPLASPATSEETSEGGFGAFLKQQTASASESETPSQPAPAKPAQPATKPPSVLKTLVVNPPPNKSGLTKLVTASGSPSTAKPASAPSSDSFAKTGTESQTATAPTETEPAAATSAPADSAASASSAVTSKPSSESKEPASASSEQQAPASAPVESPAAPESSAPSTPAPVESQSQAPVSTLQMMKEQGMYRNQYFKDAECFDCNHKFKVNRSSRNANCPACGANIPMEDVEINMPTTRPIKTRGDVLIRKRGIVSTDSIRCRDLRCYGTLEANVEATGDAIFCTAGTIIGTVRCRRLIIEKGADVTFLNTAYAEEIDIQARVSGSLVASGRLVIGPKGIADGDVTARAVSIEPGGELNGSMSIVSSPPKPKPVEPAADEAAPATQTPATVATETPTEVSTLEASSTEASAESEVPSSEIPLFVEVSETEVSRAESAATEVSPAETASTDTPAPAAEIPSAETTPENVSSETPDSGDNKPETPNQ